jgi:colanic acid/amylovoran biosynthesis protein
LKYVEIKGIGFPNKGADLLLSSVLKELKKRNLIACMEPYSPYHYKLNYPIMTKTSIYKYGINLLWPINLLPSYVLIRFGFIKPSQIDLILDASGFAYGDNWEPSLAKSRILSDKKTKKILLPQSLGPFTKNPSIKIANKIAKLVDKVISREHEGVEHFKNVTGRSIPYCPDITFLFQVKKNIEFKRDVLLVPNFQVFKREGSAYIENLVRVINQAISLKRTPTLLNHEGIKDQEICHKIASIIFEETKIKLETLNPETGREAKEIIASSNLVITSRYHALIAALSNNIPVVCYGWSFKYNSILKRFQVPIIDLSSSKKKDIEFIFSEDYSAIFRSPFYKKELKKIKEEVKKMWEDVFK